jgi:hypothetical protein
MRERAELRDSPKRSLTPFFLPFSLHADEMLPNHDHGNTFTRLWGLVVDGPTVCPSYSGLPILLSDVPYTRTYYVSIFSMIHPDKTRRDHPESRIQSPEGMCFIRSRDLRGSTLKQTYGGMAGIWMSVTLRERC